MGSDNRTQPSFGTAEYEKSVSDELQFLEAWEKGKIPVWSAAVRVRQIHRANLLRFATQKATLDS